MYNRHANQQSVSPLHKVLFGLLVFSASYMTTITVHAQTVIQSPGPGAPTTVTAGDAFQLNEGEDSVITGTVVNADANWVMINSAGKDMKIVLDDVNLKSEADELFSNGMQVTVTGRLKGDDFGVPLVRAKSITASQPNVVTIVP